MNCPFCRETDVGDMSGQVVCPTCKADFEVDDRGECAFVDLDDPRMPLAGQFCTQCGLVQQVKWQACAYCGNNLSKTVH